MFGEGLAIDGDDLGSKEIVGADDCAMQRREAHERLHAKEDAARRRALNTPSREIAHRRRDGDGFPCLAEGTNCREFRQNA